jgi:hypothetical protein
MTVDQFKLNLDLINSSTSETNSQPNSAHSSARNSFEIATHKFAHSVELGDLRHARMKEALLQSESFEDEFVMRMTGEV